MKDNIGVVHQLMNSDANVLCKTAQKLVDNGTIKSIDVKNELIKNIEKTPELTKTDDDIAIETKLAELNTDDEEGKNITN